uniref:PRO2893 n=1 Tax=Homo sapiens TaxID=9606 RepID=Q9P1C2_HUMAN|nr:PRO2893 [Homo sapiens]
MHSRSPFHWNSTLTMRNTSSIQWTFVHWKRLASVKEPHHSSPQLRCLRLFPHCLCSITSWT